MEEVKEIRLTQYSHGGGCGCKIAPQVLEEILKSNIAMPDNKNLLVGNSSKDDAAVYDIGNGQALISTTDFFTPIVDDPFDFGRIASANAISDIYAMGGKPILAIAILGWPIEKLPAEVAHRVIEGSRSACMEANIPLAGGHSIDSPEPFFGLAVNGLINIENLKRNDTAKEGDLLFLTKPLGVGILTTAQKRGKLPPEHLPMLIKQLGTINKIGEELGHIKGVNAMTDVTGFGLQGHLIEMTEGSNLSVELNYSKVPILPAAKEYLQQKISPDATTRNWNAYSKKINFEKGVNVIEAFGILPDPQTNGGLLIAVEEGSADQVKALLDKYGLQAHKEPIGRMVKRQEKVILCNI
jgi:selenide, water dikinase